MLNSLTPGNISDLLPLRGLKEDGNNENGNGTDGETVDQISKKSREAVRSGYPNSGRMETGGTKT